MKIKFLLFLAPLFCVMQLIAQTTRTAPLMEKTLAPNVDAQNLKMVQLQKKANVPPPPPPENLQSASINRITWSNIVLSQDSRIRELLFDKNFNPL